MEINTAIVAGTGKSGISATNLLVKHGVKVYLMRTRSGMSMISWERQEILNLSM